MYLQHAFSLSDDAVLARWVENPYFQHFTGETFFQHRSPIHPSSLSRWRGRIGEEGVEWLLTKATESALNHAQAADLVRKYAGSGALEWQGLVGRGLSSCDSGGHEAPPAPAQRG
jgi:hypothetical protein